MTREVLRSAVIAAAMALAPIGMNPADAADLGGKVPMPEPLPIQSPQADWSGLYFGGHIGADVDGDNDFVGGLQLGHNWQTGNFVYGAEGDISFADETFGSVRARAGVTHGRFLYFGTVGVAIDDNDEGLVAGGGVEYKLAQNTSIGVEALNYDLDENFTVVRGRLTWHFGGARY